MDERLDDLLELEHAGWRSLCDGTGGDFYGTTMTADARMVLADGSVMSRDDVRASLEHAPPWASYEISEPEAHPIGSDAAALIYTGTGHREGGDDFTAVMTSVYVRQRWIWQLAHYQQTPLPPA